MIFEDRYDAALHLIPLLEKYKQDDGVVLAVPRGGVPIGFLIAKHFQFPLEVLLTKKIGHPGSPELAIGAVSLEGELIENRYGVDDKYINQQIKKIRTSLQERYTLFMGDRTPQDLKDKTVIIVDDGIATGNTILVAIKLIRTKYPRKIIVAVPVAPAITAGKILNEADDFICVHISNEFFGVGQFYRDFSQVPDGEVIKYVMLRE